MGCFPFTPTVGALSELHEVCDKRISELLGMIRCNKIFMYYAYTLSTKRVSVTRYG